MKKKMFIIISILLIVTTISFTISFLIKKSSVNNEFVLGKVSSEIIETFDKDNNIKSNVFVKNTGNVSTYIRVALTFSWVDSDGNILFEEPNLGTDYIIDMSNSSSWIYGNDGFYYYILPVDAGGNTDNLIDMCKPITLYHDKNFVLDITAQSIQANPVSAVIESWNVNVINNRIVFNG